MRKKGIIEFVSQSSTGNKLFHVTVKDVCISVLILAASSLLCWWFHGFGFSDATLIMVYILGVLFISFLTSGYVCGIISSILSVNIFNFLFTVPYFSLTSYGPGYPVTLVFMFLAAFLTSYLTAQVRRQSQQHAQNAYRTEMLLNANRTLQHAQNETEILRAAGGQVSKLLIRSIVIFPVHGQRLDAPLLIPVGESTESLSITAARSRELKTAGWVMNNNVQAGASTGIFDDSVFWYLAVRVNENDEILAVAGIRSDKTENIDPFDKNLVLAMLGECAVAIEKERLRRTGEQYEFRIKQEKERSDLLRSISHDLRTPLTTISGNAALLMAGDVPSEQEKQQVYKDIHDDSVWLIDLVENLLSVTRLDNGHLSIGLCPQDISDILDETLAHVQNRAAGHGIKVIKPETIVIVNVDCRLFVQLLDNLVENALKYSGENSNIQIEAIKNGKNAIIRVSDDGFGIPDSEKEKVFDMFYTIQKADSKQNKSATDGRRGLGLGLALCRLIVQEHNGTIKVYDNIPHGSVFEICIPLNDNNDTCSIDI